HWQAAGGQQWPAVARRGRFVGCCFGLFAFVVQGHTAVPSRAGEYLTWQRTEGLEAMLLALVDAALADEGRSRARVMPWPAGRTWAMSVRHDVDRPLSPEDAAALVRR